MVGVLIHAFLAGILTIVIGKAVLGKPVRFDEVWQELRPRLPALLGLTVVVTLLISAGLLLLIIPGIWLGVLFALATPVLILERSSIGEALVRSRGLVSGSWWRTFGVLLITMLVAFLIQVVVELPFGFAVDDPWN